MELIIKIFGEGKDLNIYQMCARATVVYFIALLFIRISGRRTFGKKTAFDNTIGIILGAVLSRAVVGASPFIATVIASLCLVVIHRLLAWLCIYNKWFDHLLKGESIILFENGRVNSENLKTGLINKDDLMSDVRIKAKTNSLESISQVYLETSGEISVIKK